MSYNNTLRANARMFRKARLLVDEDASRRRYARGLSKKEADKEASNKLYSDKIQQIIDEKRDIANELSRDYNRDTSVIQEKHWSIKHLNRLSNNQDREINRNDLKLENLRNDILTLRRQIETSENEHSKKSFIVFFLKNFFLYLLAITLVTLLVKNGNINNNISKKIHLVLAAILIITTIAHLYLNRYQHSSIMSKQNFVLPRTVKEHVQ